MISKSQLAELYHISLPTLRNRLREVGMYQKKKRLYSVLEVVEIFRLLGNPKDLEDMI